MTGWAVGGLELAASLMLGLALVGFLLTFVYWMRSAPLGRFVMVWGLAVSVAALTLALLWWHLRTPDAEWQLLVSPGPSVSVPFGKRTFSGLFWGLQLYLAGAAVATMWAIRPPAMLERLSVGQVRALMGMAVLTWLSWFMLLL
ncbi:hypothetical protein QOL99_09150 [Deinococcus sp. MIMF12]|uniref:Uncharacterized protein n=1 Tax=Deinococcus rhizophilus TaxID=3049544 RepID=A0ABT7JK39_9DEIO|nr:hypothetical protein [Deinococcus rhizophilus]MDL2344318.1 hypothetical protein [Deinococcus rhizophilus]